MPPANQPRHRGRIALAISILIFSALTAGAQAPTLGATTTISSTGLSAPAAAFKISNGIYNVRGYGAACDGTTNDTAAFQLALAAMTNGGTLTLGGPGTCVLGTTLTLPATGHFELDGGGSTIKCTHTTATCLKLNTRTYSPASGALRIHHLRILGPGETGNTAVGLDLYDATNLEVSSVYIYDFGGDCMQIRGVLDSTFQDLEIQHCGFGGGDKSALYIESGSNYTTNQNVFTNVRPWNSNRGVYIYNGIGLTFTNPLFQSNTKEGILIKQGQSLTFTNAWLENSGGYDFNVDPDVGMAVRGLKLDTPFAASTSVSLRIGGNGTVYTTNILGGQVGDTEITSASQYTSIEGTRFIGNYTDNGVGTRRVDGTFHYTQEQFKRGADMSDSGVPYPVVGVKGISGTQQSVHNLRGHVWINDTDSFTLVTFSQAEADSNYYVTCTNVFASDYVANQTYSCFISLKTSTGFRINTVAAPGTGKSARYDWIMVR